ncbi:unnamed protein product [Clonostachys byssicola]|uniref:Uncharacterized protein n=1 Tax=Clonostachys byssicola TaxID=160290 RepID=A0A9N9U7P5_9HYPO|nr:unnamed protein product [Clonostachys byssicola]
MTGRTPVASGTDTDAIIRVNQTSDKVIFCLCLDGAFKLKVSLNEVSGSPRRLTFVRRDKPRETETWSQSFDPLGRILEVVSLKNKCLSITLLYLPSPMMAIIIQSDYGLDRRNQEP